MAGYVELSVDQGATFSSVLRITDDATGANVDVTGYTVLSQLRRSYYAANAVNVTCTLTDAANGEVALSMTSGVTANLRSGKYLFDLIYRTTANDTVRVIEGIMFINPSVTR